MEFCLNRGASKKPIRINARVVAMIAIAFIVTGCVHDAVTIRYYPLINREINPGPFSPPGSPHFIASEYCILAIENTDTEAKEFIFDPDLLGVDLPDKVYKLSALDGSKPLKKMIVPKGASLSHPGRITIRIKSSDDLTPDRNKWVPLRYFDPAGVNHVLMVKEPKNKEVELWEENFGPGAKPLCPGEKP